MLPCYVIQDLLPSHLEGLTSQDTDREITAHLRECEGCRNAKTAMSGQLVLETAPPKEKIIFRKLRRQQIIGAVMSALVTLFCIVGLYNLEYDIDLSSTDSIEQAINDVLPYDNPDADFVKMVTIKDRVFVLYRSGGEGDYTGHGVAHFQRGIFGKYRLRETADTTWPLLHYFIAEIRGRSYMVISGVNEPVGAETFRIYPNYPDADWFVGSRLEDSIPLPEGEPAYDGPTGKELLILEPLSEAEAQAQYWPYYELYYDAEGNLMDSGEIAAQYGYDGNRDTGGVAVGEPYRVYLFMAIVALIGLVFVRYFLVP